MNAKAFLKAKRSHWGIENRLHWVLDIAFREDMSRVRKDHAPENLTILRHMAINMLKQENTAKVGIQAKRFTRRLGRSLPAQGLGGLKCDYPIFVSSRDRRQGL